MNGGESALLKIDNNFLRNPVLGLPTDKRSGLPKVYEGSGYRMHAGQVSLTFEGKKIFVEELPSQEDVTYIAPLLKESVGREMEAYWLERGISLRLSAKVIRCIERIRAGRLEARYMTGTTLHAKIYCSEICAADLVVVEMSERQDMWDFLNVKGFSPVTISKIWGSPHALVYRTLDRVRQPISPRFPWLLTEEEE